MPNAAPKLYFDNPVGRVLEHPDGYAHVEFEPGPRLLQHLQAFLIQIGQLLRSRGWNKMFSDQRQMAPFVPEESSWIVDYWLNIAQQGTNAIYGAVLLPHDVFARLSVSQVMSEAKTAALTYRMFDTEADARAWLRQLA